MKSTTKPVVTNTIFETKQIIINENGKEIMALKVSLYNEAQSKKESIYQNTIRLGERDFILPLPDQYKMLITKNGTLKIEKCENTNKIVFKLDNHDIEFYGNLQDAKSIDIQSANACNIIGELKLDGRFRLRAKKFHLTNTLEKQGVLQTRSLDAQTQSFTNRGIISCSNQQKILANHPALLKTDLFDNRGGYFEAGLASINTRAALNDKGTVYVDKNLDFYLKQSFTNGNGNICSEKGNIDFIEEGPSNVELTTGGKIYAPQGRLNCNLNKIQNNTGGHIEARTANLIRTEKPSIGMINDGTIITHAGCNLHGKTFTNNGRVINLTGILFFNVNNLELNSTVSQHGGIVSGDKIVTIPLASFKDVDNALYAANHFILELLHSQDLNNKISTGKSIKIISYHGKVIIRGNIQSELDIVIQTPFEWGETNSIEIHGQLIAKDIIVLQGKGVVLTTDATASASKVMTDCTNVNFGGRVDGNIIEVNGAEVYTAALNATKDIKSRAIRSTFGGFAKAGCNIAIDAQDTIQILGLLQAGYAINLTAAHSIVTGVNAQLKSEIVQLESKNIYLNGKTATVKRLEIKGSDSVVIRGETFSEEDMKITAQTFLPQAPIKAKKLELDVKKIIADRKSEMIANRITLNETTEMINCEVITDGTKIIFTDRQWGHMEKTTSEQMIVYLQQIDSELSELEEENRKSHKKKKRKMILKFALGTIAGAIFAPIIGPAICASLGITNSIAVAAVEGAIAGTTRASITGENVLTSAFQGGLTGAFDSIAGNAFSHIKSTPLREGLKASANGTLQTVMNGGNPVNNIGVAGAAACLGNVIAPATQKSATSLLVETKNSVTRSFISNGAQAIVNRRPLEDVLVRSAVNGLQTAVQSATRPNPENIGINVVREEKKLSSSTRSIQRKFNVSGQTQNTPPDEKKSQISHARSSQSRNDDKLPPLQQRQYSNKSGDLKSSSEQSIDTIEFSRNQTINNKPTSQTSHFFDKMRRNKDQIQRAFNCNTVGNAAKDKELDRAEVYKSAIDCMLDLAAMTEKGDVSSEYEWIKILYGVYIDVLAKKQAEEAHQQAFRQCMKSKSFVRDIDYQSAGPIKIPD